MDTIDTLYSQGIDNDKDLFNLYKLDAQSYDYDNHKHNEKIEEMLKSRDIRHDIAYLFRCPDEQVVYLDEQMDAQAKYLYTGLHIIDLNTHEVLNGRNADVKRYLDYEVNKYKTNLMENCKNNSTDSKIGTIEYKPIIKGLSREEIVKKIKTAVTCFSVAAGVIVTAGVAGPKSDDVSEYLNDHRYLVTDEKFRTADNTGYYYLHNNIAKNVINSNEDKDSLIYAVYNEVKHDASTINGHDINQIYYNMDLIMKDLALNSDEYLYNDFDEYLISKNCLDEKGQVNINMYDSMMHEHISKMLEENNYSFNGGKTR